MRNAIPRQVRIKAYFAWLFIASPSLCHANAGIPMIFLTLPMMVIGLLPIILLEALVATRILELPFRKLLKCFSIANLVSTLVGIPVTWVLLVVLEILTGISVNFVLTGLGGAEVWESPAALVFGFILQAPWLAPSEFDLNLMIPAATLVLLIPFFFASWWVEYAVVRRYLPDVDRSLVRRSVRNVNFLSYSGLALYVVVRLYFS